MGRWKMIAILALLAGGLLLRSGGCSGEAVKEDSAGESAAAPGGSGPVLPEGTVRMGEELTQRQGLRLAALRENPKAHLGTVLLVEATAQAVCQRAGCWMTIGEGSEDEAPIWVRWSTGCGGKYAFPKDIAGRRVLVQGTLVEKEISSETARHIAGENARLDPEAIQGKTYEIEATACAVLPEATSPGPMS